MVKPIPEGYHSVTPYLIVEGASDLIDFTKQALGAQERMRMPGPGGQIAHAEIQIGDSVVMLSDASPENPPTSAMIHLYVPDADSVYSRALQAGATSLREPADQFYGDRSAGVKDKFGNQWWLATHVEDVPPEEMEKRAAAQGQPAGG
jgi:PhnB protein